MYTVALSGLLTSGAMLPQVSVRQPSIKMGKRGDAGPNKSLHQGFLISTVATCTFLFTSGAIGLGDRGTDRSKLLSLEL